MAKEKLSEAQEYEVLIINNNNNNFNDNRGQEGPIVKIRRIILTGVLYVGYSMHS